ncbi:D-2-hydroxyacid dehydrogenase family protein [soil metagenome]
MDDSAQPGQLRVVVLDDHQQVAHRCGPWADLGPEVEVEFWSEHVADADELVRRLAGAEVVVAMRERTAFPAELLERLTDLRLLVTTGPFNAAIDVGAAQRLGIVVSGTGGTRTPTSELAWGLILAVARHIPAEHAAIRAGGWQTTLGVGLHGRRLGVVGLGHLGGAVARVGLAFGMDVVAWSQNLDPEKARSMGVTPVARDEVFETADVVTLHLVLSDRTRHVVGARELGLMKPTAFLVNTSRGGLVDEPALVDALASGRIAGAGLDVFEQEPLAHDAPLRALPNVVLTPHIGYVTDESYAIFFADAVDDIAAFLAGSPKRVVSVRA